MNTDLKLPLLGLIDLHIDARGASKGGLLVVTVVAILVNLAAATAILMFSLNHILSTGSVNIWSALGLFVVLQFLASIAAGDPRRS